MPGSGGTCLYSQHLLGRSRELSEFEASLIYRVSSRTARVTQRKPVSKNKIKNLCKFIKMHVGHALQTQSHTYGSGFVPQISSDFLDNKNLMSSDLHVSRGCQYLAYRS